MSSVAFFLFISQYYILLGLTHLSTYNCRYKGLFRSQDVAIKVFKADSISGNMQREFAQEVYILRLNSNSCFVQIINTLVSCTLECLYTFLVCLIQESSAQECGTIYRFMYKTSTLVHRYW